MAANAAPNVWAQMNYVPPRGPCNFKPNIMSAKCPCLRFMLHPLKSSSSYECDGCNHHASFHSMENKQEDEIRKRWELEAKEREDQDDREASRPRKRLRQVENGKEAAGAASDNIFALEYDFDTDILRSGTPKEVSAEMKRVGDLLSRVAGPGASTKAKARPTKGRATATRGATSRAKAKTSSVDHDDDYTEVVEVD